MASLSERYSKSIRKHLHDLASMAYERELGEHLAELEGSFQAWRKEEMCASELSEQVHEYHQGPARETFLLYQSLKADQIVARGIALGLLEEAEVPSPVREALVDEIRRFRSLREATA